MLLIFSLIFYAWGEPKYVFLLILMAFVAWLCAIKVEKYRGTVKAKLWVFISTATDILLIVFFKYAAFLCSIVNYSSDFINSIALPLGISFYTFQLLTYVIDIYRGEASAQENYFNVLLYAALFHQCVAGPIVRYKSVSTELFVQRDSADSLMPGVRRFTSGLAKKTLLANPCGALADSILLTTSAASDVTMFSQNLSVLKGLTVLNSWTGVIAYALQIYLDFSAYSDMAIGLGKMIGLNYMENFNYPYISSSVTEFWRRWHISLGTFFKDYVYIPLGGNRCSRARNIINLFIVWGLTGLWHGASWNFVLWGLYFFIFLVVEKLFLYKILNRHKVLPHIYLILIVLFGWILFRFTDMRLGFAVFANLFGLNGNSFNDMISTVLLQNNIFLITASVIVCTPLLKYISFGFEKLKSVPGLSGFYSLTADFIMPGTLLILSTCCLVGDSYNPFIYFQF